MNELIKPQQDLFSSNPKNPQVHCHKFRNCIFAHSAPLVGASVIPFPFYNSYTI